MAIHPTAVIHPGAQLPSSVEVGPYAIIEDGVILGEGCQVGAHVHLRTGLIAGAGNVFDTGCVMAGAPQDLRYKGAPTRVCIGDRNIFREHVTVHRANKPEEDTVLGSGNMLMAHCHVGHNARIGNQVIIANGALIAGHVRLDDRAFISGNCLIHQFVSVGTLALMQGGSAISKDLPPFCIARGDNGVSGLNVIGLRRAGFDSPTRLELRRLYQAIFRSTARRQAALEAAQALVTTDQGRLFLDFIRTSTRGVVSERQRAGRSGGSSGGDGADAE